MEYIKSLRRSNVLYLITGYDKTCKYKQYVNARFPTEDWRSMQLSH